MAKRRTHSEVEHLRGIVKQLKSENRNLKKRLKQLERKEHIFDDHDYEDDYEEQESTTEGETCPSCTRSVLEEMILGPRILKVCKVCLYRRTEKNG